MRALWVKAGVITNVVEYPNALPETEDGCDVVQAVPGLESVGEAFNITNALNDRRMDKMEMVIFKELHRMNNLLRGLEIPAKAALTGAQYRTFLKTLI